MSVYKKILLVLLILFMAIQILQPTHNSGGQVLPTDITKTVNIPDNVLGILKTSCYDCHSNNTRYPWYVYIQPLGWIMARHIKEGKINLNFSDFGSYSKRRQVTKLRAIQTSITDGSMPLSSYTIMHAYAKLSAVDVKLITEWTSIASDSLAQVTKETK